MDVQAIEGLGARLGQFLADFADCFGRREPAAHAERYVRGQMTDLPRKSIEPMALHFGIPPRTLQQFLAAAHWDEDRMRQRIAERVAARYTHPQAVGIIDETSFPKKGRKTPGVQRQHCGASGKQDNCVVTVHLAYTAPGGLRALLDGELFLPEGWSADRARCRAAGLPAEMVYRPKWRIALDLRDRAVAQGVVLPWLSVDAGYGRFPQFHRELDQRGQGFVAEVPANLYGWCVRPQPLYKQHHPDRQGPLKVKGPTASRVDDLARYSPVFYRQAWEPFRIKDTQKGPVVWEARFATFYISHEGVPGRPVWLIVARNVLDPHEVKYFVCNAPLNTPRPQMLRVAFARYPIERCFEDDKTEIGLDHFEVRNYHSLKRHLILSALTLLFLAEVRQEDRGKKPGVDRVPGADGSQCTDGGALDAGGQTAGVSATTSLDHRLYAAQDRHGPPVPLAEGLAATARQGYQALTPAALSA
jgi:SRSO17 transposase